MLGRAFTFKHTITFLPRSSLISLVPYFTLGLITLLINFCKYPLRIALRVKLKFLKGFSLLRPKFERFSRGSLSVFFNLTESSLSWQESEALELYNRGLALQQKGDYTASEEAYNQLLNSALVKEVTEAKYDIFHFTMWIIFVIITLYIRCIST